MEIFYMYLDKFLYIFIPVSAGFLIAFIFFYLKIPSHIEQEYQRKIEDIEKVHVEILEKLKKFNAHIEAYYKLQEEYKRLAAINTELHKKLTKTRKKLVKGETVNENK